MATPGTWKQIGNDGDWSDTIAAVTLNNRLYTVDTSGALYETNLSSGDYKQLGESDFKNTAFLVAANNKLYSIEADGNLYEIEV